MDVPESGIAAELFPGPVSGGTQFPANGSRTAPDDGGDVVLFVTRFH